MSKTHESLKEAEKFARLINKTLCHKPDYTVVIEDENGNPATCKMSFAQDNEIPFSVSF